MSAVLLYACDETVAAFAAEHSWCDACGNSGAIEYADHTAGPCPCYEVDGVSAADL